MTPDLRTAIAAGIIVLFCAVLILIDVVLEHLHRVDDDEAGRAAHRDLMAELRRHAEPES